MSRFIVLSLVVASLSSIVGCGASQASRVTTTTAVMNVDVRDEASWTPPEEIAVSFKESPKPEGAAPTTGTTDQERMRGSYRPNRQERPSAGAVHAATN